MQVPYIWFTNSYRQSILRNTGYSHQQTADISYDDYVEKFLLVREQPYNHLVNSIATVVSMVQNRALVNKLCV